jgi:coniferyl-aldehyde dehydrogenase
MVLTTRGGCRVGGRFDGVGPSGMGSYRGIDGFRTFSHAKEVYHQAKIQMVAEMFRPPYDATKRKRVLSMIKK